MKSAMTRDQLVADLIAYVDSQIDGGEEGTRLLKLTLGRGGRIGPRAIQVLQKPERFIPLAHASEPRGESA